MGSLTEVAIVVGLTLLAGIFVAAEIALVSLRRSRLAQLVDENRRAWHVSANYRASLNGGVLTRYEGVNVNNLSVGIEHGGFASQRTWSPGLINRSVALVRGIVRRHGIPADRYHVVAHGRLQPESRTDPGPNWPWTSYLQSIAGGSARSLRPPKKPPRSSSASASSATPTTAFCTRGCIIMLSRASREAASAPLAAPAGVCCAQTTPRARKGNGCATRAAPHRLAPNR